MVELISLTRRSMLAVCCVTASLAAQGPAAPLPLPTALSDSAFWALANNLSEPGGLFQSENFTSNEPLSPIVDRLGYTGHIGGAYIGVGPEQNFSYVAQIRPSIAFVVDIRREAITQHLMYKAIFELNGTRVDFVSMLFARPRPAGLDTASSIGAILAAFADVPVDSMAVARHFEAITHDLLTTHGFALDAADYSDLEHLYDVFTSLGPSVNYAGTITAPITFATLMASLDEKSVPRSFLASEAAYRAVRDLQLRNLIIPVVGDFAGAKAVRGVGAYLTQHGATLKAFYVSNVEQYLFRTDGAWQRFYESVETIPLDSTSTFIRPGPLPLCPMTDYLRAYDAGRVRVYMDAVRCVN